MKQVPERPDLCRTRSDGRTDNHTYRSADLARQPRLAIITVRDWRSRAQSPCRLGPADRRQSGCAGTMHNIYYGAIAKVTSLVVWRRWFMYVMDVENLLLLVMPSAPTDG